MNTPPFHSSVIQTLRPRQWVKSAFIFAPALFSLKIADPAMWLPLLAGTFGFSFIASSVYAFNDVCNRSEDRLHPRKKHRPIASGAISTGASLGLVGLCAISGSALMYYSGLIPLLYAMVYSFLMMMYSVWLRRILLVDIIVIAIGFVLRIKIGGAIVSEPVSEWLMLCTFTMALYLALVKRRQEIAAYALVSSEDSTASTRAVLGDYPPLNVLDGWINTLTAMTILCYALYTVDPVTIARHNTSALIYTLPFVLYGVFRYQKIALKDSGGEDPTSLVLGDHGIQLALLIWLIAVALILYSAV